MLKITTTNGDTLIHADQQPDAKTIQGYDGSRVLVHGGAWEKHKYIRKEGNKYIYPEDLQKANDVQKHHAEVLADRRQAKKDRAHVKENKEITNVMRKELRNYGMNLSKEEANQLRRNINTNSQIQSAHQRTVSTVPGTYNQERRATDAKAAKAEIAERRKRKEAENRPLRTADQQASAHQVSIKKTDNSDGTKEMWRRSPDAETAKAQIKDRREKKKKRVEDQRKSAHSGYERNKKIFPDGGSTEELEIQKDKTKARKTQKRVEEILKKKREANRPKSRNKNVTSGGKKIKTGKSTNDGRTAYP